MTSNDHDAPELRSAEWEVEVPGTPEQVWEAIATGPGITAWFVPAEVDGRKGGPVSFDHMGSGMEPSGVVTVWDPPRRLAFEEEWQPTEGVAPATFATEFLIEARGGGTCVVRLVCSGFGSGVEWDSELENMDDGWRAFLHNLRVYLTHYPGQPCSTVRVTGSAEGPLDRAWDALTGALGLPVAAVGELTATSAAGAPTLGGVVERMDAGKTMRALMLRTDAPARGVAFVYVFTYHGKVFTVLHAYLFGDEAPVVAARDEPAWRSWMDEHFPSDREVSDASATTA